MIYGYIRVSTDKQTTENQRFEIENFAQKNGIAINRWFEETISGATDFRQRKLGKLLKKLTKNDILIASEISRLGRNMLQVMTILHYCLSAEAQVWTIKDNYRLGSDIQSKVLAFAFGLSAEIERNLISQRTKEALIRPRQQKTKTHRRRRTHQPYVGKENSQGPNCPPTQGRPHDAFTFSETAAKTHFLRGNSRLIYK